MPIRTRCLLRRVGGVAIEATPALDGGAARQAHPARAGERNRGRAAMDLVIRHVTERDLEAVHEILLPDLGGVRWDRSTCGGIG
jgi:hypothetical protein